MNMITNFHFLRPWMLLLFAPAAALIWHIARRQESGRSMRAVIAPHLLPHLLVGQNRQKKIKPIHLLTAFWLIAIISLAGPTWRREPSPFIADSAGLVIAVKVTPSMLAQDIQPSRLARVVQKIHDLLQRRSGAVTALIAYSGTAHLAMPLTSDAKIIEMYAQALEPEIMPGKGDGAAQAVNLAARLLEKAGVPGSILLMTDDINESELADLGTPRPYPIHIYAFAADKSVNVPPDSPPAPALNLSGLKKAASAAKADLIIVSPDERDINKLNSKISKSLALAQENQGDRWQDVGYWLLPFLLVLGLVFFRQGWIVDYE